MGDFFPILWPSQIIQGSLLQALLLDYMNFNWFGQPPIQGRNFEVLGHVTSPDNLPGF